MRNNIFKRPAKKRKDVITNFPSVIKVTAAKSIYLAVMQWFNLVIFAASKFP